MTACICLDYKAIERFFRSCALSISMQQSIEIEWVEYKDSAVLNVAYSIFFWKEGPGHVEVNIATAAELENKIERLTNRYVQTFITKIHEAGFFAANEFAQQMYGLKQAARESINNAFTSAREINNEIINVTTTAIKKAAAIKLAAGVGVALISGTAGVLAVSGATSIGGWPSVATSPRGLLSVAGHRDNTSAMDLGFQCYSLLARAGQFSGGLRTLWERSRRYAF